MGFESPTVTFDSQTKQELFDLLRPSEVGNGNHQYSRDDLKNLTYNLMESLGIAYDNRVATLLDEQSNDVRLYRPFALMLACLAGNPFEDRLADYIADARSIIQTNGWTRDDVRTLLGKASESLFAYRARLSPADD